MASRATPVPGLALVKGDWKVQVDGRYRAPAEYPQGTFAGYVSHSAAVNRDFYDGKLRASVRVSDLFDQRQWSYTSEGSDFFQDGTFKRQSRFVYASLTWSWGKLEPGQKRGRGGLTAARAAFRRYPDALPNGPPSFTMAARTLPPGRAPSAAVGATRLPARSSPALRTPRWDHRRPPEGRRHPAPRTGCRGLRRRRRGHSSRSRRPLRPARHRPAGPGRLPRTLARPAPPLGIPDRGGHRTTGSAGRRPCPFRRTHNDSLEPRRPHRSCSWP